MSRRKAVLVSRGGSSAWHKQNKRMLATNFAVCVTPLLLTVEERIVALRDAISALTFQA
jgi:hypothetical protein